MTKRRRPEWRKKAPINLYKLLSILLIFIFIILTPAFIKKLIIINKIICVSQVGDCPPEILSGIEGFGLRNYKDLKKQSDKILTESHMVDTYLIQYQIPSTMKIDMVIKNPTVALKTGDKLFLTDSEGLILEATTKTGLPILNTQGLDLTPGNRLSEEAGFAANVTRSISSLYAIESAYFDNTKYEIKLVGGPVIKFPLSGDHDVAVGAVRLIYSRLNEGKEGFRMEDVSEIDLRYDNPVVR